MPVHHKALYNTHTSHTLYLEPIDLSLTIYQYVFEDWEETNMVIGKMFTEVHLSTGSGPDLRLPVDNTNI